MSGMPTNNPERECAPTQWYVCIVLTLVRYCATPACLSATDAHCGESVVQRRSAISPSRDECDNSTRILTVGVHWLVSVEPTCFARDRSLTEPGPSFDPISKSVTAKSIQQVLKISLISGRVTEHWADKNWSAKHAKRKSL
jgi:hypothetical protein